MGVKPPPLSGLLSTWLVSSVLSPCPRGWGTCRPQPPRPLAFRAEGVLLGGWAPHPCVPARHVESSGRRHAGPWGRSSREMRADAGWHGVAQGGTGWHRVAEPRQRQLLTCSGSERCRFHSRVSVLSTRTVSRGARAQGTPSVSVCARGWMAALALGVFGDAGVRG